MMYGPFNHQQVEREKVLVERGVASFLHSSLFIIFDSRHNLLLCRLLNAKEEEEEDEAEKKPDREKETGA
jgi:hypothetical protein